MTARIKTITDVAENFLCSGCGACAYISGGSIEMVDDLDSGRRPVVGGAHDVAEAMEVCPGLGLDHTYDETDPQLNRDLEAAWGPVFKVFEGHASDPEVRLAGSSGGVATALGIYSFEEAGYHGLLHTAARKDVPYLNETVMGQTREQVLAAAGSRYAPASPCDGLGLIEDAPKPCVFIGKPCDIAAAQKARRLRPKLDQNLGLTIAIFCAGTPSTNGTLLMLKEMGIDPEQLESVRYRGNGWPGRATAVAQAPEGEVVRDMSYQESWGGPLSSNCQWRCALCPDHTGEFADISVGDPWHRPVEPGDPGRSLVVARTQRGLDMLQRACADNRLSLVEVPPENLPASQPNLLRTRGAVWARLIACRLVGLSVPRFVRMKMFGSWMSVLTFREKMKSVLGTLNRVRRKRIYRRRKVVPRKP